MTPSELRDQLVSLFPEFAGRWDSPANVFKESGSSFSFCGVFAEFSHFVRERFSSFPQTSVDQLGSFLEVCLDGSDSDLDTAATTCFLENLSGEDFTPRLSSHLGPKARLFLAHYEHDAL